MPIESCRYARAKSCKISQDDEERVPSFGYCATQEQKYFGYKFHCACTPSGLIYRYDLSQAHHHNIKYLHDLKDDISNCYLVGDKGYRSTPWRLTLFEYAGIELATPCRSNELLQYAMPEDYQRLRKRVEVVFFTTCRPIQRPKKLCENATRIFRQSNIEGYIIHTSSIH